MNPPGGGEKATAKISFVHSPLISLSRPSPGMSFPIFRFNTTLSDMRNRGKAPDKMDEMCLTYSLQTARGRSQNDEPKTYSICLRKVYPHEVTDYLLGKGWRTQQTNNIPLPPEGQPVQERYLDEPESSTKPDEDETRYWEQGWYLWTTSSNKNAVEKLLLMSQSLKFQDRYLQDKFHREKDEQNEQVWIEQLHGRIRVELDGTLSSIPPSDYLHYHWCVRAFRIPVPIIHRDTGRVHLSHKSLRHSVHSLIQCAGFSLQPPKSWIFFGEALSLGHNESLRVGCGRKGVHQILSSSDAVFVKRHGR